MAGGKITALRFWEEYGAETGVFANKPVLSHTEEGQSWML
jgi:hypothetical protein